MVANNYYLEYSAIGIFGSCALLCGILLLGKSKENKENINLINLKNNQEKIMNSIEILAKPILHFSEIEPKLKNIINDNIKSYEEYSHYHTIDDGVYQGWIGKSTFEDYSLEATIIKKEFKTFNENLLWITAPLNPDGVNWLVKNLFNTSFNPVFIENNSTMTLYSKMYEWNGSTDITIKFTFINIPDERSTDLYTTWLNTFISKSENIFNNILWEHTLIDIC